jgi:hypothetical protein
MCLRNFRGIVARMFARERGELRIGVRLAAESAVNKAVAPHLGLPAT